SGADYFFGAGLGGAAVGMKGSGNRQGHLRRTTRPGRAGSRPATADPGPTKGRRRGPDGGHRGSVTPHPGRPPRGRIGDGYGPPAAGRGAVGPAEITGPAVFPRSCRGTAAPSATSRPRPSSPERRRAAPAIPGSCEG